MEERLKTLDNLKFILETLDDEFTNPNVLLLGDFNMKKYSVKSFKKLNYSSLLKTDEITFKRTFKKTKFSAKC